MVLDAESCHYMAHHDAAKMVNRQKADLKIQQERRQELLNEVIKITNTIRSQNWDKDEILKENKALKEDIKRCIEDNIEIFPQYQKRPKNFENFKKQRFITIDNCSDKWNLDSNTTNLNSSAFCNINSPSQKKTSAKKAVTKDDFSGRKEGPGMFNLGSELDKFFDAKLTSSVITPLKEPRRPTIEDNILGSAFNTGQKKQSESEKLTASLTGFESNLKMAGKNELVKIYKRSLDIKNNAKKKLNKFLVAKALYKNFLKMIEEDIDNVFSCKRCYKKFKSSENNANACKTHQGVKVEKPCIKCKKIGIFDCCSTCLYCSEGCFSSKHIPQMKRHAASHNQVKIATS